MMQKFVEFVRLLINWLVWIFRGTLRTPETIGPKRFENRWLTPLRGFSMLLLILIPAWLWLASLLSTTPEQTRSVLMPLCPSVRYVSLKQLYKQTARYAGRKLWIAGQLVRGKQLCARQQCKKNTTCCHPCTSSLRLQDGAYSVKLKGFLRGKWLSCTGTTCKMSCAPLKVGRWFAFAGRLRRAGRTRQKNTLPSFYVTHACRTSRSIFTQHRSTIPNPEQLRHLQRQQSKTKKRR